MLNSIIDYIRNIISSIVEIPSKIIQSLSSLLKTLFIPSDSYFSNKFNEIKSDFASKFGFDTYIELFNALKSNVSGSIDFGGFIDISMWAEYMPVLQGFIRGVYYILAVIFNIRMVIWLIRGATPIKDSGQRGE